MGHKVLRVWFGGGEEIRVYYEVTNAILLWVMSCWDDISLNEVRHAWDHLIHAMRVSGKSV